jgi:pimeloyl-[acyl-carrier protein] synthase
MVTNGNVPRVQLRLSSRASLQDPDSVYRRAHAAGPLFIDPELDSYVLCGFDNIRRVLKLESTFRQHSEFHEKMVGGRDFLGMAEPEHGEVRDIFNPFFTPRAVRHLADFVGDVIDSSLAEYEVAVANGRSFEAMSSLCRPVAAGALAKLLELPPDDIDQFITWADSIARTTTQALVEADERRRLELEEMGAASVRSQRAYAGELIKARRGGDSRRDVVCAFANSDAALRLAPNDQQANIARLILGGHDNIAKVLGNCLAIFGGSPSQWRLLVDQTDLIPHAIEEVLRVVSPAPMIQRVVEENFVFADRCLPAGSRVYVLLGAANHDESRWADPYEFNISREYKLNLAFGTGPHVCIGSAMTRMVLQVFLEHLISRRPNFRLSKSAIEYGPVFPQRGPLALYLA